ncbi:MAG: hypothetical protein AAFP84_18445 [Actinomycetota bacterium]
MSLENAGPGTLDTATDVGDESRGELVADASIADDGDARDPGGAGDGPRRRLDKGLLAACFVIACGLALITWGLFSAQTGTEGVDRPEVIENLSPVENAVQVLQQERIVVDLQSGYEAELIVDGIALETTRIGELDFNSVEPGQQVSTPPTAVFDPGNSRIEFAPSEGAQIEDFSEGRHRATVVYWRIDEGRESARSYTWSFDVI